jgi:hypothetical protein
MALTQRRALGAALLAAGALALSVAAAGTASASTVHPDGTTEFFVSGPTPALAIGLADYFAEREGFDPATQCTNVVAYVGPNLYNDTITCTS